MNIKVKLFIFFVIVIILFFIIRTIIYNNYIKSLSNIKENFESKIEINKKAVELNTLNLNTPNYLLNILNNPTLIYSTIACEIIIVTNNNIILIKNNKIKQIELSVFFSEKYNLINHRKNFEGGYYNYKNDTLNMFIGSTLVCYSNTKKKVLFSESKEKYFNKKNIKNVLVFFDTLIIFQKNEISFKDIETLKDKEDFTYKSLFEKIPKNMSACFINFLDIQKNIPLGTPTFIKNGDIYTIDFNENKILGPRSVQNGFSSNTECAIYNKTNKNFNVVESGLYRIFIFGAGMDKGGYGGLVFNDIYLKNKDKLTFNCGSQGERLPVKNSSGNSLSKVYSIKLPYNGSCSGSGASIFSVNNDIKLIGGGGGGWSSEILEPPSYCHSQKLDLNNQRNFSEKVKNIIPIKKLILSSQVSKNNIRYKIKVNKFDVDIYNTENTRIDVNVLPPLESFSDKKYIYETDYSSIDNSAQIEFTFENPVTDYKIALNYIIESSPNSDFANSKVTLVDEQYRKYVIDNFNYTFNYKYITGETITKFFNPGNKCQFNKQLNFISDGYSIKDDINNINKSDKDFIEFETIIDKMENENRYLLLKGGYGGGGHCYSDRKDNIIVSCGGGGYNGGDTLVRDNKNEYCGGQGGTSFVKEPNFKGDWLNLCNYSFVNNLNNKDGLLIIQKINKRVAQNEFKSKRKLNNNNNNNLNTVNFFNRNIEKFYNKNANELNRERVITPLNSLINSKKFKLKTGDLKSNKKNIVFETNVDDNFDSICFAIKCSERFSVIFIGWNENTYSRYLIGEDTQEDDLSQQNHGYNKLNKKNMTKYLKTLLNNNIYKHTNIIKNENDIKNGFSYKLTSMKNYVYYSNNNSRTEIIKVNPEFSKIFIAINVDSDSEKELNYVINKFNMKNEDINDIKKRTNFYL